MFLAHVALVRNLRREREGVVEEVLAEVVAELPIFGKCSANFAAGTLSNDSIFKLCSYSMRNLHSEMFGYFGIDKHFRRILPRRRMRARPRAASSPSRRSPRDQRR